MTKGIKDLLEKRLGKKDLSHKMTHLAKRATEGHLSSFSGVFRPASLTLKDKEVLGKIIEDYAGEERGERDLERLIEITSEVRAIQSQAALLHGERIKQAHTILTKYQDGAFSRWLVAAYGNRQTPYNFWQYYEFYLSLPQELQLKVEKMPRQAIYTLASRKGDFDLKKKIVLAYKGETKGDLLQEIRSYFPLNEEDRRGKSPLERLKTLLKELKTDLIRSQAKLNEPEKKVLLDLLNDNLKVLQ